MSTDTLNRRLRFADPSPKVRHLWLTDADLAVFQAINRHGPLPSNYLYEFTRHLRRDESHLKNRLTEFYNGDDGGQYLVRPPRQFDGFEARYQHMVYDLSPRARGALAERGLLGRFSPRRTDPFLHQLMGACVASSIELLTTAKGLRYIPRDEILAHPRCPRDTKDAANPLALPLLSQDRRSLVPDDLFGIEYPGVGFRFFAVEIDRNTESIERRNLDNNTFGRKIAAYLTVLRGRLFRSHWGIPNLHILTVTTNGMHAMNILEYLRRLNEADLAERFHFQFAPAFGAHWRVPKTLLYSLLGEPWTTVSGTWDIACPNGSRGSGGHGAGATPPH